MKLTNERLIFPGTKGEIEEENEFHKFHTSLIMEYKKTKILFDFGLKHSPVLDERINEFDAIFITHSHPDHYIWTIEDPTMSIKVPIYLTPVTYFSNMEKPNPQVFLSSPQFPNAPPRAHKPPKSPWQFFSVFF